MREVERINRIQLLIEELWREYYPDMRYFQFVSWLTSHIGYELGMMGSVDLFYYEDDRLEEVLKELIKKEEGHRRLREFNEFCG